MTWEFELVAGPDGNRADGPAWDGEGLLFTTVSVPSNTIHNKILRYDPGTGEVSDYRRWTNRVVGLTFLGGRYPVRLPERGQADFAVQRGRFRLGDGLQD